MGKTLRVGLIGSIAMSVGVALFNHSCHAADNPHAPITINSPNKIAWHDGPASLPKGAKMAVLEGNPSKEGPFVFRVKVPDGYRVMPHTHLKTERVTVLQGVFNIGMGDKFDEKATAPMPAGTYGYWQAGMAHYVWTKGETILQFHGMGPWSIHYLNAKDDPRAARGCLGQP